MRIPVALVAIAVLSSCQSQVRLLEAEGTIRVEPSTVAGSNYVVHLQNRVDFGFNPDEKANRDKWALDYLKKQCPAGKVVDEKVIETGSYLIGGASRVYYIYVRC